MDKKLKINSILNIITKLLTIIVPLITAPYVARVMNADLIGQYSFSLSIATYFVLFAGLGISNYGTRQIAKYRENKQEMSNIFYECMIIKVISVFVASLGLATLAFFYKTYQVYLLILIINVISVFFDIQFFYQGIEDFKTIFARNLLSKIISLICIFVFVKNENDIYVYVLIMSLAIFIPNISMFLGLKNKIVRPKNLNVKRHIKYVIEMFLPVIAISVYTILDKTMIGIITKDEAQNGYYEQAYKIVEVGVVLTTAITPVLLPRITNIEEKEEKKKIMNFAFLFVYFICFPLMIGLIMCSDLFVPVFFGEGYEGTIILLQVFSILPFIIGMSNVVGFLYLNSNLLTKTSFKITLTGAMVNFFLNIILIYFYQALGAAIATIISELVVTILHLKALRKEHSILEIFKISKKYIFASFGMLIAMLLVRNLLNLNNILVLLISALMGMGIYFIILLIEKEKITNYALRKLLCGGKSRE